MSLRPLIKYLSSDSRARKSKMGGFTLIELMVTVGIFVFMTALVLAKYNNFYSGTIFKNLAYDIALTVRQAQTYGISVKVRDDPAAKNFDSAYGIRFSVASAADLKKFSLSAYNKNGAGYSRLTDDNLRTFNIKNGAKIQSICLGISTLTCTDILNITNSQNVLDVIFQRPNPDAIFCTANGNVCNTYKYAKINLIAADNETTKTVMINNVGQITVN